MAFYPDILDMFNGSSFTDDGQLDDEMDSDRPIGMRDMQAWADSLAIAGGVLGAVYEDNGMLMQGHYLQDAEPAEKPAQPAFDPHECTVLRAPMNVRRGSITIRPRL